MNTRGRKTGIKIFLMILPMLLFSIIFVYYPFIKTIVHSFSLVNAKGVIKGFAGLDNYRYVFGRSDFRDALKHTLILTLINVPATLFVTIGLALLAEKKRRLSPLYETLFSLPMSVSMSAACMIFKSMFSPSVGFINYFFGLKCGWFESSETALMSCLILTIWMGIGFDFMVLLSALRSIPKQIIETTRVDGIGTLRRIFCVQLPLISPTIFYVFCTNFVLAMMTSAPMIIILGSTPEAASASTLMSMMYRSGIASSDYALAAVLSITAFLLTFAFMLLSFVFERRKVHYQ